MNRTHLIFFFVFANLCISAQERLGITNSNYYCTAGIHLNPTASVDARTYMQLHLAGANFYIKTNFAYLPDFSIRQIRNIPEPLRTEGGSKKYLYLNASIEGPSFVMSKRTYGVGFFTRVRMVMDMRRVSYELASALLNGQAFVSAENRDLLGQNFKNAKFSSLSWAEYGVNFGKMIRRKKDIIISVAGNLKYLTGINIMYANILEFNSYNDGNGAFGVSSLNAKVLRNQLQWKSGRGLGMDLGITYKIMEGYVDKYYANSRMSNCDYVDYKCKVGLSLRDAGYVRFKGAGNTDTRVVGSGHFDPSRIDTAFVEAIEYNFKNTTVTGKPILACLPTALTGQFDYNFDNSVYLNFTVVKNLVPTRITGVQSPDLLSVCPRFEVLPLEIAMPLTLQKFRYPQLGLALRLRSLVVGMDNIFPLFMKTDTYGFNLYFSIAVTIFRNPACAGKRISVSDCSPFKSGKNKIKKKKNTMSNRKR